MIGAPGRGLAVVTLAVVACGQGADKKPADRKPPPDPLGSAAPIPEPATIDWKNLHYDLGSLGTVKATGGRAEFRVVEDDDLTLHATQDPAASSDWAGFLDVDDPAYVDLDGMVTTRQRSVRAQERAARPVAARVRRVRVHASRRQPRQARHDHRRADARLAIEGSTIKTSDGKRWTWDTTGQALIERR